MAIFITGDTHGDFTRFKKKIFYEQAELTKDDCVMIAGDFGGIWDGSAEERHWLDWLDWLEAKPFTTLFVSGNHENFDMLAEFPIEDWHGESKSRQSPAQRVCREDEEQGSGRSFWRSRKRSLADFATSRVGPAATTSRTASWSRTIRCSRRNAEGWTPGARCTGWTTAPGGSRSCPAGRSTRPPGPTWTERVGRWTTSSATAVPLRCRTN